MVEHEDGMGGYRAIVLGTLATGLVGFLAWATVTLLAVSHEFVIMQQDLREARTVQERNVVRIIGWEAKDAEHTAEIEALQRRQQDLSTWMSDLQERLRWLERQQPKPPGGVP